MDALILFSFHGIHLPRPIPLGGRQVDWRNLLQPNRNTTSIRFRAMMESGQFVDEVADIVQTQVLAHGSRASIRNRDSVPLYFHTEEDRPPTWMENLLVETGLSPPPDTDSRYIMEDSRNLHKGIKTGAVELDPASQLQKNMLKILANVTAVVVFLGCLWYAGLGAGPETTEIEAAEEAVTEEYGHGFVEQVEGPATEEEGGEGAEAGREGNGQGTEAAGEGAGPAGSDRGQGGAETGRGGGGEGGADPEAGGRGPGGDAEDQAEPGGGPEQDQAPDVAGAS